MYRFIDAGPFWEHITRRTEFVAFDLETTGLEPETERITEIGAVRFTLERHLGNFNQLIDPGRSIHPDAVRVSGITDLMVRGQPAVETVLEPFLDFVDSAPLVAHNAPFDASFLCLALRRAGRPLPANPIFDTCLLAKTLWPHFPRYSLTRVLDALGIAHDTLHRALEDAAACRDVFVRITEKIMDEKLLTNALRFRAALCLTEDDVDQPV
jgi:DNA polymerase III epsilon subunit family exonuclease